MTRSLNLRFSGTAPPHEDDAHAPGGAIADYLFETLSARGWAGTNPDLWRGSGWRLCFRRGNAELELVFARGADDTEWLLQVAPTTAPGFVGRALGRSPSAALADLEHLLGDTRTALASRGFDNFRMRADEDPDRPES